MDHEELMRSYYRTYNSEDPAALRNFYAEDVVLLSAEGEMRGPGAILAMYGYLIGQFSDQMTPTAIRSEGHIAIVDIADRFTAKVDVADFMGASLKKGEVLELRLRGTYTIADGRLRRIVIEAV